MSVDVVQELSSTGLVPIDQAQDIARYIEAYDGDDESATGVEALELRRKIGELPKVVSRSPRNWLINWKSMLFDVAPRTAGAGTALIQSVNAVTLLVAGAGATAATLLWPLTGALACLGAVYALVKAQDVELSGDHAAVVLLLWRDARNEQRQVIPEDELTEQVSGQLNTLGLSEILADLSRLGIITHDQKRRTITKRDQFRAEG